MRNFLPPRPSMLDAAIAAVAALFITLVTVGAAAAQHSYRPPDAFAVGCAVLAAGSLAWRRVSPLFELGSAVVVVGTYLMADYAYGPIVLCVVVAMFETARQLDWTRSLPACAIAASVIAIANVFRESHQATSVGLLLLLGWGSWLIIPWSLGALAHARAAAAERSRRDLAARAKLAERMRVAREVHDIAGHGFATAAMQAGVALLVFDEQPDQAKRSLESIKTSSTKALTELRTMLDAFYPQAESDHRVAEPDTAAADASRSGEGGVHQLEDLVETVRAGGLPVELDIEMMGTTVPDDVGTAAYRVVQESLTNVLRHAGPTTAVVRVYRDGSELVTEVDDRGIGAEGAPVHAGRGLTGMRDRVEATGGTVTASPRDGGGFRVAARLPLPEANA